MFFPGRIEDFMPDAECVGCYVVYNGKVLFLQKQDHNEFYPGKWGAPAGHVENGESYVSAIRREISEEAGIEVAASPANGTLVYLGRWAVVHPRMKFTYRLFRANLTDYGLPPVRLSDEHKDFRWLRPNEAAKLDLIEDEEKILQTVFLL